MEPDIDKIEAYLTGNLTDTDRQAFEAEIAGDPILAEEVDALRLAREAVELSISDSLRAQFQEWQEVEASGSKTEEAKVVQLAPRRNLRRVLSIAASVLFILALGSFWYANDQFANDALAMGYYQELSIDGPNRGGDDTAMTRAINDLKNEAYSEADTYFRSVQQGDAQYYDARYYLAHSLYRQGETAEALEILNLLDNGINPNLQENADWLKVLIYLDQEQTENPDFRSILSEMVDDSGHSYHQDAVELVRKLDSFWYNLAN